MLRAWGKLGYPRRAKRLHECATVIAREHDDVVPDDVETLLALPGVGEYTARAVACFAYGQPGAGRRHQRAQGRRPSGPRASPKRLRAAARPRRRSPRCCPNDADRGALFGGADGAGRDGVHRPVAPLRRMPAERVRLAGRSATRPRTSGPPRPDGTRAPTGRCAAGYWMCCAPTISGVTPCILEVAWLTDTDQRDRALALTAGRRAGGADRRTAATRWPARPGPETCQGRRTGAGNPTA